MCNTKEVMQKTILLRRNPGNQVTSIQLPYIQMVREIVVRVLDFCLCENLKRGQENRGRVLDWSENPARMVVIQLVKDRRRKMTES